MTDTRKEHRSSALVSSKQTLKESSVQFELLQESSDVTTVQSYTQQGKLLQVTMFDVGNLPEIGRKTR